MASSNLPADAAEPEAAELGSRLERIVFTVRGAQARDAFERAVATAGL